MKERKCFNCPLSPYILWHHGLIYSECPLSPSQRDMGACERCQLNDRKHKPKKRKSEPVVEKRKKESIPNIGKTYTSD